MINPKNKSELEYTLRLIIQGCGKGELKKKLGIKPTALSNRLRRLDELGCIELFGKYGIKVIRSSLDNPKVTRNQVHKKLNKRGHAFNFKVLFPKEENSLLEKDKIKKEYAQKRIKKLDFGSFQLKYKGYTIWINKNSLTIYSNNYYCSDDALHSKFRQLKEVDNLIQYLKERYEIRGIYGIEVFREHYGLIFNKFAEWLLKRKGKMYVKDKGDKVILWVDDSRKDDIGLKEFEGKDAVQINTADKFFDSKEKTGWKDDTPQVENNTADIKDTKEVLHKAVIQIKKNAENLDYHAENMRSHVGATRDLGEAARDLKTEAKAIRVEREKTNFLLENLTQLIKTKF